MVGHDEGEGAGARSFYTMDDLECQIFIRNNRLEFSILFGCFCKNILQTLLGERSEPHTGVFNRDFA